MSAWHPLTLDQKGYNSKIVTPHFTGHPPFTFENSDQWTGGHFYCPRKHFFHFIYCTVKYLNHYSMCGMSQWFFKSIATTTCCTICTFSLYLPSFKQEMKDSGKSRNKGFRAPLRWQCNQCRDKWNCQSAQSSPRDDVVVDCKCGRTSGGFHPPWSQPETIRSGYWLLLILICHDCCPHKQHMASQLTRDIYTTGHRYQHATLYII